MSNISVNISADLKNKISKIAQKAAAPLTNALLWH